MPGGAAPGRQDVVAAERGNRERGDGLEPEPAGERFVLLGDALEYALGVADRVQLVDREDGLADAHQQGDMAVPPSLGHNPLAGIDQNEGEIGVRRARDQAARVLRVTGRVDGDEYPLVGLETAVGDGGGVAFAPSAPALRAGSGQPVEESRPPAARRTAKDEAQRLLVVAGCEQGVQVCGGGVAAWLSHQGRPSCLVSTEPIPSRTNARATASAFR